MKFERKDINLYKKQVKEARLNATSIPNFFDIYAKVLLDVFQVEMEFTSYPDYIVDKNSSHNTPIGKKGAWLQDEINNPDIPNTNKAYTGQIEGHIVKNDGIYHDDQFEGYDMFWTFSDLSLDFANGTPNGQGNTGRGSDFSVTVFLFLEDFPLIYRNYRKQDHIDKANKALERTLVVYKKQISKIHQQLQNDDEILQDINTQIQSAEEVLKTLKNHKRQQIDKLQIQANKTGLPLPKIENGYLNLNEYNQLKKASNAQEVKADQESLNNVFNIVTKITETFNSYKDEYACDFL